MTQFVSPPSTVHYSPSTRPAVLCLYFLLSTSSPSTEVKEERWSGGPRLGRGRRVGGQVRGQGFSSTDRRLFRGKFSCGGLANAVTARWRGAGIRLWCTRWAGLGDVGSLSIRGLAADPAGHIDCRCGVCISGGGVIGLGFLVAVESVKNLFGPLGVSAHLRA